MRYRPSFSTPLFALFVYLFYLSLTFAFVHLFHISGDNPSLIIDLLPVVLGIFVPAVFSFIFLRKTKTPPGFFWVISTITMTLISLALYPLVMRNCTPTTCDDDVVWFVPIVFISLGFLIGAISYKLADTSIPRNPPTDKL